MSPHHVDSPLVSARPFKVRRSHLFISREPRIESNIANSNNESGWLAKKNQVQPSSSSLSHQDWDKDLLNFYGSHAGTPETLRETPSHNAVATHKVVTSKTPRSTLSTLLGEEPTAPSGSQCDTSMTGQQTRASTDSSETGLEMPSGSGTGSSRLTSPVSHKDSDSEMASPETPKSGKRKRQTLQDVSSPRSRKRVVKAGVSNESDDEIIMVDDTDTPAKPPRALRSATVLTDYSKLCEFPVGKEKTKDSVSVCLSDYKTLEHDTFLNDIIIDFYLTYMYHVFLSKLDRPTVHIFSTMFYKRLNSNPKIASTVASYEMDSSLKPAEKRHMRVKGWTKNVNLFEKNMVIIPICEHSHWYLVIAIRPGLITIPVGSKDRQTKGEPFMIVLDSMGGNKTAAVTNIRQYLAAEWKAKICGDEGDEDEYEFSSKEMKTVRPKKPEQENYSDCGIYLLHYIEKMFVSVAQYYWPSSIQDLNNWFTTEEISTKRDEIATLIRTLAEDQNSDKEMNFPSINFLPVVPVTRSKRRNKDFQYSSESEEDDWGKGQVLGGGSGFAAGGFYGEKRGTTRNLRSGDSSSATGDTSGESDVSSYTASEIARESKSAIREDLHPDSKFVCTYCGFQTSRKNNLATHKQSRHEGKKYQCGQCDYQATTKGSLTRHQESIHEGKKYKCNECDYEGTQTYNIIRHQQSVHKRTYKLTQKDNLIAHRHQQSIHEGKMYKCNQCHFEGTRKVHLTAHQQSVHERKKYKCNYCEYQATRNSNLIRHQYSLHNGETQV